jgi:hypothetical protein
MAEGAGYLVAGHLQRFLAPDRIMASAARLAMKHNAPIGARGSVGFLITVPERIARHPGSSAILTKNSRGRGEGQISRMVQGVAARPQSPLLFRVRACAKTENRATFQVSRKSSLTLISPTSLTDLPRRGR